VAIKLLVLGRRPDDAELSDAGMDDVEAKSVPSDAFVVRRCDAPSDLPGIVEAVAQRHGPIDLLELHDHGHVGFLRMGNDVLFESDGSPDTDLVGAELAASLREHLRDTAHVRLLGCVTTGATIDAMAGRLLLTKLAAVLGGHRVVFGTIQSVWTEDFTTTGFDAALEATKLFSSLAALDGGPPHIRARLAHLDQITRAPRS
jgi:hypothetical protein